MRQQVIVADESADRLGQLTKAQLRIVRALVDGRLNKQIAHDLGLGEATVKSHLAAAFRKLGVRNRTQAAMLIQAVEAQSGHA